MIPSLFLGSASSTRSEAAHGFDGARSERPRAVDRDAPHVTALAVIVVERVVQRAAVVPEGERVALPPEAALELRPDRMRAEIVDERLAFLFRHVLEAKREGAIDEERLAARLRMRAHHGMLD